MTTGAEHITNTVQLYLGDSRKILPTFPNQSVDTIITDPPYLEGDFSDLLFEFLRIAKRVVITPGKLESFNWIRRQAPSWEYAWKCSGTKSLGGSACLHILFEPVLAYGFPLRPLGSDLLDYPLVVDPYANGHPWPKPLALFSKLVGHFTNEGDTVLDPFMGSGTTGKACVQGQRKFIGIDINATYFSIAKKRIGQAQKQLSFPGLSTAKQAMMWQEG